MQRSDYLGTTRTRSRYYKDNEAAVKRRNGYRRIRELMAGGRRQYYELPTDERESMTRVARDMYDAGIDYATAVQHQATDKRGFVYIISHPRFMGYLKIGRAFNPESRLAGYQTGCPERAYRLDYAVYFEDCYAVERDIHTLLGDSRAQGEWFAVPRHVAEALIDNFKECEHVG